MRLFALTLVLLIIAGALLAPRDRALSVVSPVEDQRVVYVSPEYSIFTMLADGTNRERITSGVSLGGVQAQPFLQQMLRFTWPTFSPDGRRLVVSRFSGLDRGNVAALSLMEPPSSEETFLQVSGQGLVDRVADGTFHFPLWSPNGEHLALVAPNDDATALLLSIGDFGYDGQGESIEITGAPIYLTWSRDSSLMAIHHRSDLLFRDSDGQLFNTGRPSTRYRVPAISGDSSTLAYLANIGDGERLISRRVATGEERELVFVAYEAAFAFSPTDHDMLALAVRSEERSVEYLGLSLVNIVTGEEQTVYDETVIAFWWSPDGTRIALVGTGQDSFTWMILDVATGQVIHLEDFIPSSDFTTYLQFFDQFALSHNIWSADSTAITFAGQLLFDDDRTRADGAWVLDVDGRRAPASLGEAVLAFFVPVDRVR